MSRREFQFTEGSSNKFWAITALGKKFTVEFGRIGTKGQTQEKQFDSEEEDASGRRQAHRREDEERLRRNWCRNGPLTRCHNSPDQTQSETGRRTGDASSRPRSRGPCCHTNHRPGPGGLAPRRLASAPPSGKAGRGVVFGAGEVPPTAARGCRCGGICLPSARQPR